jgi:hypothetical protein
MTGLIDSKLVEQYSGTGASGYDQQREQTPRFQSEERVFSDLFDRCAPDWVVDCPVGTGRWHESYRRLDGRLTGVDASKAMLAKAAEKYRAAGINAFLKEGSIFDASCFQPLMQHGDGLVVCVRFMNWIESNQISPALNSLSQCQPKHMIVGVSVRPREWSGWKSFMARVALLKYNFVALAKRMSQPKVHDECYVLDSFERCGWQVAAREFVYEDKARKNFFYLLAPHRP